MHQPLHGIRQRPPALEACCGSSLKSDQINTRMIPVAPHLRRQSFHICRIAAHQPVLVHDQHTEAVTGLQQFRRWRVVRGANGVVTHVLQTSHTKRLQRIRQRRADSRMVLMIAGSLDHVMLSVQQKSFVRIKRHSANAEFRLGAIRHFPSDVTVVISL